MNNLEIADHLIRSGAIDIIVANGFKNAIGGAPNLLLMNDPGLPGNFVDATETNLPTSGTVGLRDNTQNVAVGDFDADGDVDLVFANQTNTLAPYGFRMLLNRGNGVFDRR